MSRQGRASNVSDPQVVRALALLMEMARSRRGIPFKQFAEKRSYPLRAVYRARDVLVKAGAPIRVNPESAGRWQLMEGWLPPAVIGAARDELMALFVARHLAPGLRGTAVGKALDGLWAKLSSAGGAQQSLPLDELAMPFSVRSVSAIDYSTHRMTIDALRTAIERKHAVQIAYCSADSVTTERVIEPGFLHWDGGLEAMYAPSWCRLRGATRVFAVHRIRTVSPLPEERARSVPSKRVLEKSFRVWYRDRVEHVEVAFGARVAAEIRERRWHSSQRLVEAGGGGVRLHLDVSAPEELERWILGFGPDARVVSPARLADAIQDLHARAAGANRASYAKAPAKRRGSAVPTTPAVRNRRSG
jgi:predicted DNA-binding transcriptional regulator YafY